MKNILFVSAIAILALSALFYTIPSGKIVKAEDFESYLNPIHLEKAKEKKAQQIDFWTKKLQHAPGNTVYQKKLAHLHASYFKLSGDISQLHLSDSLLRNINNRIPDKVGILQSLATNAITRHAFAEAEQYANQALQTGEKLFVSSLIKTDILLERGALEEAQMLMDALGSNQQFDYRIRKVKLQDQAGDLDSAIVEMEKAAASAKASNLPDMINWSLSNLGDLYGHQGRIKKSYETYLEALSYDPADLHSLKGIAWIAFSNSNNTELAKAVLGFLKSIHPIPDYDLLLADIAHYERDSIQAEASKKAFLATANDPLYGNMYQRHLCLLKAPTHAAEGLDIAKAEVRERPHPMSFDLMAWASFCKGEYSEALRIAQEHVIGQTEEPLALYHSGLIFKENGQRSMARKYLKAAEEAAFELGPVITRDIEMQLKRL